MLYRPFWLVAIVVLGCKPSSEAASSANPVGNWEMVQPAGSQYSRVTINVRQDGTKTSDLVFTNGWTAHYSGTWHMENGTEMVGKDLECQLNGDFNPHAVQELRAGIGKKDRGTIKIEGNTMTTTSFKTPGVSYTWKRI